MPTIDFSIDLHVHPGYKPLGNSYKANAGKQSADTNNDSSLWYYDPPTLIDKALNFIGSLTKFSQTNLTAAAYGRVWVISASLGSIEKWFFNNKLGTGFISDTVDNFAAELSKPGIDNIQNMTDYFTSLKTDFDFFEAMNNQEVVIDGKHFVYRIVNNFQELQQAVAENEETVAAGDTSKAIIISILFSIEGMHVLNCGLDPERRPDNIKANADEVKAHARELKNFKYKPWFITFSHHFYNELCGHSQSLITIVAKFCDQTVGMGTGFTPLGLEVLDILLNNTEGKRIFIDIKHLSPEGRNEYFGLLKTKYKNEKIPVIITHGVANGLPDKDTAHSNYPELGNTFNNGEINFYDNEIVEMVKSDGIMGLQLDERRVASADTLKHTRHSLFKNKIMHYRSQLLWNQIQYIAELLDKNDLYAWGNLAIGSDYDGIVDPLNSFWTTEEYPDLKSYLERHAFNYIQNEAPKRLKNSFNIVSADVIVQNIFQNNAWRFFEKWF